jgi:hypothetical protein
MEAMMMAFKKGCRRFFWYIGCILASGGVYMQLREAVFIMGIWHFLRTLGF